MTVTILLLRGINVGGKNRLPMADLKSLATRCGATGAAHYLQSGNLAVTGPVDTDALSDAISADHGFRPLILSRSLAHWQKIVAQNPFPEVTDPKALHLFCLAGPTETTAQDLLAQAGPEERVHLTETELYLHTPAYLTGSKIAERMDRLLCTPTTARNWRSVETILTLAEGLA